MARGRTCVPSSPSVGSTRSRTARPIGGLPVFVRVLSLTHIEVRNAYPLIDFVNDNHSRLLMIATLPCGDP